MKAYIADYENRRPGEREYEDDNFVDPDEWNIILAMNRVQTLAGDSNFSDAFMEKSKSPLAFLRNKLNITDFQIVVLSIALESTRPVMMSCIADYIGCTYLTLLEHNNELNDLVNRGWINRCTAYENEPAIHIGDNVKDAFLHNCSDIAKTNDEEVTHEPPISNTQSVDEEDSRQVCATLICHKDIREKHLEYNQEDKCYIDRLVNLLVKDKFDIIQERLYERGFHKGITCVLYGEPGTGKTETVFQIAKKTGRDIMEIDISSIRSKYVGETERKLRRIFADYREACRESELAPILLFNEADAIFCNRNKNPNSALDKMENAMQNILLNELEQLDGILIATTNMTINFDEAFERRFLYRIQLHIPPAEIRAKIWRLMLPEIDKPTAAHIAEIYPFSPGQIENIARMALIDSLINDKDIDNNVVESICKKESTKHITRLAISGF